MERRFFEPQRAGLRVSGDVGGLRHHQVPNRRFHCRSGHVLHLAMRAGLRDERNGQSPAQMLTELLQAIEQSLHLEF